MAAFYTHSPNRYLPSIVKFSCIFGGYFSQVGMILFCSGLLLSFLWVNQIDSSSLHEQIITEKVPGVIASAKKTNFSSNNSVIYEHLFEFTYNGLVYEGVSYASEPLTNENVTVLVPMEEPEYAIVEGHRRKPLPLTQSVLLFPLLPPLLGLIFVLCGLPRARRSMKLLAHGQVAEGTFLRKELTLFTLISGRRGGTGNGRVYCVYFEFKTLDGQTMIISKYTSLHQMFEEGDKVLILYKPDNPWDALPTALIPGCPKITDDQKVEISRSGTLWLAWPILFSSTIGVYMFLIMELSG